MALSFQTSQGCQEVWDEMRIVQGRKPNAKEIIEGTTSSQHSDDSDYNSGKDGILYYFMIDSDIEFTLPEPTKGNLNKILKTITDSKKESVCDSLSETVLKLFKFKDYIEKLLEIFETCEDLGDLENLKILFHIFKNISILIFSKTKFYLKTLEF